MLLDSGTISFPGLGIDGINPPKTLPFTIFGREIYYYGLIITLGFLLGILYLRRRAKDFGSNFDLLTDAILCATPVAILCARIYYVAFRWEHYRTNPISVLYIWEGGIAIYGGVIGAILGLLLFARLRKQKLLPYLDLMSLGLLIGQCVGRWGNFFNREAYGAEIFSNYFLRMGIEEADGVVRYWHPTFLYESVWNLCGFVLLHLLSKKRRYNGQTFLQYLAWYGLGRVWIEGLRTDSLYIGSTGIRVSQLLAGLSFVVAVGVMLYLRLYRSEGARSKDPGSGDVEIQNAECRMQNAEEDAAGTASVRPPEEPASDPSAPVGAASGRPPEEPASDPSAPVGAASGRPPEAEAP